MTDRNDQRVVLDWDTANTLIDRAVEEKGTDYNVWFSSDV